MSETREEREKGRYIQIERDGIYNITKKGKRVPDLNVTKRENKPENSEGKLKVSFHVTELSSVEFLSGVLYQPENRTSAPVHQLHS